MLFMTQTNNTNVNVLKINEKKIEIPYDSENDLDRIIEILGISIEGE